MDAVEPSHFAAAKGIALRFVEARLAAAALADYPGPIPPDLASAYACQEAAIALWPDEIVGWKIGRIPPELEKRYAQIRLAGPIFRRSVLQAASGQTVSFPVFQGGFAAVEAEFVFQLGEDAPPAKTNWSLDDASALAGRWFMGVETAGSPLATINALGPTVVISDFGNNAGLILGPELRDLRESKFEDLRCETYVAEQLVGKGEASDLPGGPLEALRFVAEHCARRGRPLKAGMYVSTGAVTGVHDVLRDQTARIEFVGLGTIRCKAVSRLHNGRA